MAISQAPLNAPAARAPWTALLRSALARQASAALFGLLLLAMILASRLWWPEDAALARYDALFLGALAIQAALLATRLETSREAVVILAFHAVGMVMEMFKTAVGAWLYPEPCFFRIGGVPLFTGFMYAAVGSYIARSWRLLDISFHAYPPFWATVVLATAIYVNFFTHHFVWDIRNLLFVAAIGLFWRTRMTLEIAPSWRLRLPVWPLFFLVGAMLWGAENLATWSRIWLYPSQMVEWRMVAPAKIGSWSLLMIVSGVLVSALYRPDRPDDGPAPPARRRVERRSRRDSG